mgnify:CR=1 FL=1
MGQFKMEITAAGGHGCKREPKTGERVYGCRRMDCPDCVFVDIVERVARLSSGIRATFAHWPGEPGEVVDEATVTQHGHAEITRIKGQF